MEKFVKENKDKTARDQVWEREDKHAQVLAEGTHAQRMKVIDNIIDHAEKKLGTIEVTYGRYKVSEVLIKYEEEQQIIGDYDFLF